jgi:hypothetical protein
VPTTQFNGKGRGLCRILDSNQTPRTLVLVIYEEVVNQHPRMVYFAGIFSDGEVSVRALDYILEHLYLVRATLDLASFWRMRGFPWFSDIHLVLSCISQCFGR